MKIFIVCNNLNAGGAERVGVMLANGFVRKGHDVCIITDIYQSVTYDLDAEVKILPLNPCSNNKLYKWLSSLFLMRKHFVKEKPDVVIGIMQLCSFISKVGSLGLGLPVIMTEHNAFDRIPSEHLTILDYLSKFYLNRIYRCVTVLTEADKKFIGNRLKNVVVMPNPSSFPTYDGTLIKENFILSAGRISNWHVKGFDILIKAWGKIASKYPDWNLEIAGDGPKENFDFLKKKCIEEGVADRVFFLGYRTDMQNLYRKASIYVLSSRSEGLPMVLIEAMSQGCACVATDFNGRRTEIITNESEGVLCNAEDDSGLAQGMEKLIADDSYRRRVQINAMKRSEFFSLDNIIGMWMKLLQTINNENR
jgi:GalNAc-alpha-(1->4)-GalNAc-alpha-(1->3)-diNAcBac-PP-undecaprenol alpha-1,4-N-acetyl-D-galactosaminyltransferase